ncbi:hypothetical protein [Aquabacterium sp.]|uniref:hypothetical protein n=1 Tax=Aquabacterium sp. TaxID=1872578 RepID=UPI002BAB79CA|nr:hypothetical protein [Aquabacterium sp.]HSW06101.1 hypothetical protein [Aquabacterium sp.]
MSISSLQAGTAASRIMAPTPDRGRDSNFHDLTKSVRTGDLEGAQEAYKNILKNAPEAASWPQGTAFAKLGVALTKGDIDQAKTIMVDALRDARDARAVRNPEPVPPTQPTLAGSSVGSTLNLTA